MTFPMRYDPFSRNYFCNFMDRPARLFEQNFGTGLLDDDFAPMPRFRDWPSRRAFESRMKSGSSEIQYDKDKYQVMLDVQHFKPEEIIVKSVDNSITIQGQHEEKADEHGFISRSFTRRYVLPEDVKVENIECSLSTDGVLTLKAPRMIALKGEKEHRIPIISTGNPAPVREDTGKQEKRKQVDNGVNGSGSGSA